MRKRNNRVAVRMTVDEYEILSNLANQSIFQKEKLIRIILAGYTIQQKPHKEYLALAIPLRKLSTQLANMYNKFCFSNGTIGEEMCNAKKLVYNAERLLINSNYIMYYKHRKKRIKTKK